MEIVFRSISALAARESNSRTHSEAQIAQIAASIKEFGFTNPILIDENDMLIAGHGRLRAAKLLNRANVPCIVLTGLSDVQKRAYVIADNKLALNAGWDDELLSLEINELMSFGVTIDLLGFEDAEIAKLLQDTDGYGESENGEEKTLADGVSHQVIVAVCSESEQARLLSRLEQEGYKCRALMF